MYISLCLREIYKQKQLVFIYLQLLLLHLLGLCCGGGGAAAINH